MPYTSVLPHIERKYKKLGISGKEFDDLIAAATSRAKRNSSLLFAVPYLTEFYLWQDKFNGQRFPGAGPKDITMAENDQIGSGYQFTHIDGKPTRFLNFGEHVITFVPDMVDEHDAIPGPKTAIITCGFCNKVTSHPVTLLPCFHNMCERCLKLVVESTAMGVALSTCPQCTGGKEHIRGVYYHYPDYACDFTTSSYHYDQVVMAHRYPQALPSFNLPENGLVLLIASFNMNEEMLRNARRVVPLSALFKRMVDGVLFTPANNSYYIEALKWQQKPFVNEQKNRDLMDQIQFQYDSKVLTDGIPNALLQRVRSEMCRIVYRMYSDGNVENQGEWSALYPYHDILRAGLLSLNIAEANIATLDSTLSE